MYLLLVPLGIMSALYTICCVFMSSICFCMLFDVPARYDNSVVFIVLIPTFPVMLETKTLFCKRSLFTIVVAAPVIIFCFVLIY